MLGKLARQHDPNVLVGFDHADDAGVYLLTPEQALVQTVDFFTPIVDDPYTFGQIAATNSLSDVYAMGGKPLTSLALVCFPEKGDLEILERILAGGLSKMIEAGCTVVGGHSIRDDETKFGYSVTGVVHPKKCVRTGHVPAGLKANREFAECVVEYEVAIPEDLKTLLFDPQTAGGLFVSIAADDCEKFVLELKGLGIDARYIGNVTESSKPLIQVS